MQRDGGTPLNEISSLWTVVSRASGGLSETAAAAREQLLDRYGAAVYRYLLGAVRDTHDAEELAQEFALRFLRGDLRRADPDRGRFRDFVKGTLFHLIADYHRKRRKGGPPLPVDGFDLPAPSAAPDPDGSFVNSWRDQLLHDAWAGLAQFQQETGRPLHDVLRLRADHPEMRSPQMAELLSARMAKPVSADWVRQTLHRARDRFADLLIQQVAQTLREPSRAKLEEELIELSLLSYCRTALERYQGI
jgi:RNA polymerase sigma-70 factor (ECF subfamily)